MRSDSYVTGLKVGRMIQTIWVSWVTSLVGQVGLICKINYLDVTWMSYLVSEWTLGLMNAQKYRWCETNLSQLQAVLKHVVSKDLIFKKSVQGTSFVTCQESRNLCHCSMSKICHVTLATFLKRKFQHVGHMWITSGLFCWSNGSTGVTHFQPCHAMS